MPPAPRETVINLRAPAERRALIDQAASLSGKTRTEFMLDAATEKAQQLMLDRTVFALDPKQFQKFVETLEKPAASGAALRKLLTRKAPWETNGR